MKRILVIGVNGQLGKCLKKLESKYKFQYQFYFTDTEELDVTDEESIETIFSSFQPDYCINASGYTAVDLAEEESEKAYEVNAYGVEKVANACQKYDSIFIHVSTDYVFHGNSNISYDEDNFTQPTNVYGKSKLLGEELALETNEKTIVIRTSWLYSEFNKNFLKTMMDLFSKKEEINVVSDQYGQPTNANDLAEAIMTIIQYPEKTMGVYHYSNEPETTWYLFAKKIAEFTSSKIKINPITTSEYPTSADRPKRSTLALDKIKEDYPIEIINWENSLKKCIKTLQSES